MKNTIIKHETVKALSSQLTINNIFDFNQQVDNNKQIQETNQRSTNNRQSTNKEVVFFQQSKQRFLPTKVIYNKYHL